MNAIRFPEGCHDGCETSKSPFVSWRGLAPARAGTRNRCSRLSRVPPSSCQSVVRMTRATCFFGSPVQNRTSSPCETNAIVRPSGDQSGAPTAPWGAAQTRSASPPSGSIRKSSASVSSSGFPVLARSEMKAIVRPSGDHAGAESLHFPWVSRRGRPPVDGTSQRFTW